MKILFYSDVDGTLAPNIWLPDDQRQPKAGLDALIEKMNEIIAGGGDTVIATGRPFGLVTGDKILAPLPLTKMVTSNGVEINERGADGTYASNAAYTTYLLTPPENKLPFSSAELTGHVAHLVGKGDAIAAGLTPQPAVMVAGERIAYFAEPDGDQAAQKQTLLQFIQTVINDLGMDAKPQVSYDAHHDKFNVEAMPVKADKLGAGKFLLTEVLKDKKYDAVVICGDSGNDISMMQPALWKQLGIPVVACLAPANASKELVSHLDTLKAQGNIVAVATSGKEADGILESLNTALPAIKAAVEAPKSTRTVVAAPKLTV